MRSLQPPHESTAVIKEELESVQDLRREEKAALESIEGEENFKISNDRPHDVHVQTWTIAIAIENDDEKNSEELVEESERIKIPNAELGRLLSGEQSIPVRTGYLRVSPFIFTERGQESDQFCSRVDCDGKSYRKQR